MTIRTSVQPFSDRIADAYARLFPGDADKAPERLQERFVRNPHGAGRFAVAERADVIVGLIALVPTPLRDGATQVRGLQAIDTVVDPDARGQGVFVALGKAAQDPAQSEADVLWGFPNDNAAPGWFGKLGWRRFGTVPFMVRPLRTGYVLRRLHPALGRVDLPLLRTGGRFPAEPLQAGPALDRFTEACSAQLGLTVERGAEWLTWRLPPDTYRTVTLSGGGEIQALVSTRIADKHGGRICYVMEALCRPGQEGALARLLRSELGTAAGAGAEVALAWCPRDAFNRRIYRRAGFLPFPSALRPTEIHFGARPLTPAGEAFLKQDAARRWHLSYLDSDTV